MAVPQIELAEFTLNSEGIKKEVKGLAAFMERAFDNLEVPDKKLKASAKKTGTKTGKTLADSTAKSFEKEADKEFQEAGESSGKEFSKGFKKETKGAFGGLSKGLDDLKGKFSGAAGAGGGLGDILSGPLGKAGIAGGVVAGLGLATKAVFDFTQEINATRNQVRQLTGESGENLNKLTADIKAVSNTFNADFNETLLATNALAKQFGIETNEALSLIEKGFLAGADVNGDFLAQLQEYPTQLKAVGLNAEDTISILTQQVKSGVFSDKGVDTIKEAGLRLRELPKSTRDALDAIGLSSDEIEKSLADGSKSIFEVIQDVSTQLDTLPPQSAVVGQAVADIFGGPGEDAGLDYIKTLGNVELSLDKVIDKGDEFTKTQQAQLDINKALEGLKVDVGQALAPVISEGLKFITDTILPIVRDLADTLLPIFQQLFTTIASLAKKVIPISTLPLKLLAPLAKILFAILDPILKIVDVILTQLQPVIDDLINVFLELADEIAVLIEDIMPDLMTIIKPVVKIIGEILVAAIKTLVVAIRIMIPIIKGVMTVFKFLLGVLTDVVDFIATGLIDTFNWLVDTTVSVGKAILDFLVAPFKIAYGIFTDVVTVVKDIIDNIFPDLGGVIDEVSGAVNGLIDGFVGLFTATEKAGDKQPPLKKKLDETGEGLDKVKEKADETNQAFSDLIVGLGKVKKPKDLAPLVNLMNSLKREGKLSAQEVAILDGKIKAIKDSFKDGKPPVDAFTKATQKLQKEVDKGTKQLALMILEGKAGTKKFEALETQVTQNKEILNSYNDALKTATKRTQETKKSSEDLRKEFAGLIATGGVLPGVVEKYRQEIELAEQAERNEAKAIEQANRLLNAQIKLRNEISDQKGGGAEPPLPLLPETETPRLIDEQEVTAVDKLILLADSFGVLELATQSFESAMSSTFSSIDSQIANNAITFENYFKAVGQGFVDFGKQYLIDTLELVQKEILLKTPAIMATSIELLGPIAGIPAGLAAIALIQGLLSVGKAAIGAQEGGEVGKIRSKPGPRDTVQMALEPGEQVTKARQAKKYRKLLAAINNNDTFALQQEASKLITGGANDTGMYVIDQTGTLRAMETNNKLLFEVSEKLNALEKATLVKSVRNHNIKQDVKVMQEIKSENYLM